MKSFRVILLLTNLYFLTITTAAHSAGFSMNGFDLRRAPALELLELYDCSPRLELNGIVECNLRTPEPGYASSPRSALLASDGTALFAQKNDWYSGDITDVAVTVAARITQELGGTHPELTEDYGIIIATWGETRLEAIKSYTIEFQEIDDTIEERYGVVLALGETIEEAKASWYPMFRIGGGDGVAAVISDQGDGNVLVQRIVAAGGSLSEENFRFQAREFVSADINNAADDSSDWYDIAFMIRRLALNTSPERANDLVDEVFGSPGNDKYHSHVWAVIPTSVLNHLNESMYTALDIFGENTEFPEIRAQIIRQIETEPGAAFSEFLFYALGRFDEAVEFKASSPIQTILLYAQAHFRTRALMAHVVDVVSRENDLELLEDSIQNYDFREHDYIFESYPEWTPSAEDERLAKKDFFAGVAYAGIPDSLDEYQDARPTVTQLLNYLNKFPERYGSVPMVDTVPNFRELSDDILPIFAGVMQDRSSRHFDDAYYYFAWLTYHRGDVDEALNMFGDLISYRNSSTSDDKNGYAFEDYSDMALIQLNRIFRTLPPDQVLAKIRENDSLSRKSDVWMTALKLFFQSHQYDRVMSGAREAMAQFGVQIDTLSVTTDPGRTHDELSRLGFPSDSDMVDLWNLTDIVYLHRASREILRMEERISAAGDRRDADLEEDLRELILKYALVSDEALQAVQSGAIPGPLHRDIRQSLYLLRTALDLLPDDNPEFREWLHYKRIRLLAEFDPVRVGVANGDFENEFPNSKLLDDGLAEQIFAEAVIIGDMARAERTFSEIRQRFANSNALDNAYSWMAIGWTCVGQPDRAREIDQEIIDRFPRSRHAGYAMQRIQNPQNCGELGYMWDYRAMQWREKNRIDEMQIAAGTRNPSRLENPRNSRNVSPPSLEQTILSDAEAVSLMSKVLDLHSMPGRQGLDEMSVIYADRVDYFGNITDLSAVMIDKRNYFDRWPLRDYELIDESLQADCAGGQVCTISGYFDWSVESIERERTAAGTAFFEFSISAQPPHRVLKEDSKVVSRQ